jgi:hypothetical protein
MAERTLKGFAVAAPFKAPRMKFVFNPVCRLARLSRRWW